jgi:chromate transporter
MRDVFRAFLHLGLTSFGGPVAHLAYFRHEFVERRRWIDAALFGQIVAFCSVLPGPTSSQVGIVVGYRRAGAGGALAAWLGFTLPSALAMTALGALLTAVEAGGTQPHPWLDGLLAGLTAAATAVIAQAVLAMAKVQCPDRPTQTIAAGAAMLAVALSGAPVFGWLPIAGGALAGAVVRARAAVGPSGEPRLSIAVPRAVAATAGGLFLAIVAAVAVTGPAPAGVFAATIVRAGSLVFGGGHVVLPLLQTLVPAGLVGSRDFYAGYGATQAMPGPLFTFAAFLGFVNRSPLHGWPGAAAATALIFAPAFCLVFALLPGLRALQANVAAASALRGANAAVVGLLSALLLSLVDELGRSPLRVALAVGAFALLTSWRAAPWIVVVATGVVALLGALAGLRL